MKLEPTKKEETNRMYEILKIPAGSGIILECNHPQFLKIDSEQKPEDFGRGKKTIFYHPV